MVEWKKLGEIANITIGEFVHRDKQNPKAKYPVYNGGTTYTGFYEYYNNTGNKIVISARGYAGFVNRVFDNYWAGNSSYSIDINNSKVLWHFVYYYLKNEQYNIMSMQQKGGGLAAISKKQVQELLIPIPSLSEQQRIVSILDTFTSSISNLKQQIEERRKQYEYERDLLLDLEGKEGVEMKKLGEVGDICMCKRIMKDQTSEIGDIPFFKIGTFGGKADAYISRELFEDYKEKYSYPKKGEILISAAGTIGRTIVFNGEDAYFQDSNIVWISNNEKLVLNSFLRYLYGVIDWKIDGGTIKRLYNYNLKNATIYVPTLQAQSRIVSILDTFEQSIANLEEQLAMREKQYEYYREKLLRFEEA